MLTQIKSGVVYGINGIIIQVEVDLAGGFPGWTIVGLPDQSVREAKERIRAALKNSGLEFPSTHHITVNLAPADIPKEGPSFDVPLAVALILNKYQIQWDSNTSLFLGELTLDGSVQPIPGVLSVAIAAKNSGLTSLFVPLKNAPEAALVSEITVYPLTTLKALFDHLKGTVLIEPFTSQKNTITHLEQNTGHDISLVRGQQFAKRALEIAAAGGHNILLSGPPGSGKTLLARTLPTILPPLTKKESLEVTQLYSVAGLTSGVHGLMTTRPFRTPHHTSSAVALTGGGRIPKPGEISLAHHGVLFLDEFPEFPRNVLEILRQPLEDGEITVSRAQGTCTFPSRFMLVASQNPCPCGYAGDEEKPCTCSGTTLLNYQKKISGPLLDRIDMIIEMRRVPFEELTTTTPQGDVSVVVRERVLKARAIASERLQNTPHSINAAMGAEEINKFCTFNDDVRTLLRRASDEFHLSGRALHRILKVARTIADMAPSESILLPHIAEALQYRIKKG